MRATSEALLISALINAGDTRLGAVYGIDPEMLNGYQTEYRWCLSYQQTYGHAPSKDALLAKFEHFPWTDATDAAFAADEVRQTFAQRQLRSAVRGAAMAISEGDYTEAEMSLATYAPLSAVRPPQNALHDMSFLSAYDDKPDALELPWRTLQIVTGGMRQGDLYYLAARLNQGKSWQMLDVVAHALMQGRVVNLFSLEMPREQMLTRLHVVLGKRLGIPVDHVAMRDKTFPARDYRALVNRIRDEVPGAPYIYDSSDGPCSPASLAARASDADLSVVDYAGLMAAPLGKRAVDDWRVMASISNELKQIAIARKTRILALAQINREGDSISKYPPKVKNLAQSDALGQDGDVVLTHKQFAKSASIWSVEKNRHGAAGIYFYSRFLPNEGAFHEISKETAEDLRDREDMD